MTLAASSSTHLITSSMTQHTCRKRLSLPSPVPFTQPLSHAIYSNATICRLWRHKPLFPWRHSTWSKEIGWYGAISSCCFTGWAWVAHSDYSYNGDYECYKDNWLTVQTEGHLKYCQCEVWFVCRSVSFIYCNCNLLTVQLDLHVK